MAEISTAYDMSNMGNAVLLAVTSIIILAVMIEVRLTNMPVVAIVSKLSKWTVKVFYRRVTRAEVKYKRDIEIGKINSKNKRVKIYRFLSELIIDLKLSEYDVKPYELLATVTTATLLIVSIASQLVLGSAWYTFILSPIGVVTVFCIMYTKANNAHDQRIEAVLEAENIISNGISAGVVASIRANVMALPKQVRPDFEDFLDNIEYKKYHVRTALLELNNRLGYIADDFIKKCITLELDEQKGTADIFKEVVEINNTKLELRRQQKRNMAKVTTEYKIGASMIIIFLVGTMVIYKNVRVFYFTTGIGKIVLIIDILMFLGEYVYMTAQKAKEL